MKIKLERAPAQKILHVTEEVSRQNLDVLKAGAAKLVESEPRVVVIDFAEASVPDFGTFQPDMRNAISSRGGAIFFVGPQAGLDAPSLAELEKKLADPLTRLLLIETQLKSAQAALTAKKAELEKQLAASQAHDPRAAQKQQTTLRKTIAQTEALILDLVKRVTLPTLAKSPTSHANLPKVQQVLDEVLKTQGVLS